LPIMVDIATPRPFVAEPGKQVGGQLVQVRHVVGGQRYLARPAELDARFAQDGKGRL
jgi:hypothetical protein